MLQMTDQRAEVFGSRLNDVKCFLSDMFGEDMHLKRIESLANSTLGVMTGATLAVSLIGQALAQARGVTTKHAVKQVDRLLSNQRLVVMDCFWQWVPEVLGARKEAVVAMDWTESQGHG
jgi:hypothetical protein